MPGARSVTALIAAGDDAIADRHDRTRNCERIRRR